MTAALGLLALAMLSVLLASTLVSLLALWFGGSETGGGTVEPQASPLTSDARWIALLIGANALGGLGALALGLKLLRASPRALFPTPPCQLRSYVGALLLVVGIAPLANSVAEWITELSGGEAASARIAASAALNGTGLEFTVIVLVFALGPAIVEELLFRGVATAALLRHGKLLALLLPSATFGLYHMEPAQGAGTAVLGLAFGWARLRTGSILPSIVAHAAYNSLVLVALRITGSPPAQSAAVGEMALILGSGALTSGIGLVLLAGSHSTEFA